MPSKPRTQDDALSRMAAPVGVEQPQPFAKPGGRFPFRPSVPLDQMRYDWLRDVAHEARLPGAAIVRALLTLAGEDDDLKAKAIGRARAED